MDRFGEEKEEGHDKVVAQRTPMFTGM